MKRINCIVLFFIYFHQPNLIAQTKARSELYAQKIIDIGWAFGSHYVDEVIGNNSHYSHNDLVRIPSLSYRWLWPLNKKLYAGIGSGYEYVEVSAGHTYKPVVVNGRTGFEQVPTPGTTYHFIPIFGEARYYFRNNSESAFLTADIGSFLKLDNNEGKPRLFWGLGFGQRYKINSSKLISWGIDYHEHYLFRKKQGFDEPNENPRIASLALKIGLIF